MKLETFFEKFELIADAPGAVARMRELVLELAVRGQLSEPRSSDTWRSVKLGDLIAKGLKSIDPNSFPTQTFELWSVPSFESGEPEIVTGSSIGSTKRSIPDGSILLGKINPHLNRVWRVSRRTKHPLIASPEWIVVIPTEDWDSNYLARILASPSFNRKICATAQGMGSLTRANTRMAALIELKHPPLAEQKRIVAKVDELMALCDRLEAQQQERDTRHAALVRASLARFTEAPTPANLEFLFHPSYEVSPADLRKTILTLAVQGKLVPQDPNDEPAFALLEKIATHKANLAKAGKFRGAPSVRPIANNEADFELPANWCWVRFGDIMINRDGERIPVSKEERATKAKLYDYYGASGVIDKIDGYLFDKPLLLISEDGANLINRSTPIAFIARGKYWVNNHAHVLDGISEDFLRFIELHINAINIEKYVTGSAQPKMNQAKMNSIPIALPPLAEQRRIVAKVEQLMALVDELEQQLAASRATAEKLLTALVAGITSEPSPVGSNGTQTARGLGEESLEEEYALCPC